MCGILGNITRQPQETVDFKLALQVLRQRGPDDSGVLDLQLNSGWANLGHTRLAILDLSPTGAQPMLSEDNRYAIVFNGEIYNYKEIKSDLLQRGYRFRGSSDTEVLLNAFREFGPAVVERLDGMFAFAILDTVQETIFLARDTVGKKPLFVYADDKQFAFASEITALRKLAGISGKLTLSQNSILQYYIFGFIPGPSSIFNEINKFLPSTYAVFDMKSWRLSATTEYWNPVKSAQQIEWTNEANLLDQIDSMVGSAVKKRLVADVPICMFLSGGVDSSLVLAKAAQLGEPPHSFSVSFTGFEADETRFARKVAQRVGGRHEIIEMTNADMTTAATEILDYLDEPIADAAVLPLYHLSKQVSGRFKVALSGDGGDEVFGGYIKYNAQRTIEQFGYLRALFGFIKYFGMLPDSYRRLAEGLSKSFSRRQFIFGSGGFLPSELSAFLKWDRIDRDELYLEFEKTAKAVHHLDPVSRSMLLDFRYQLPDWYLVKSDRATMANSLEMRSPLLDKALAELMFQISGKMKVENGQLKYLLKKVAARYLPEDVIYRPKQGFGVDMLSWTKTARFRELAFESCPEVPVDRSWLEKNYQSLSPLKLMRIAFLNHYIHRLKTVS
jgi:asparagine synthase (glutamine-hydrolysing)